MEGEAIHLQQAMRNSRQGANVMAITSGKGGVGKTNIAANLAVCMAASQKRVVLVDADMSLGNIDLIMDVDSKYNISHMLNDGKNIEEIICCGPCGVEIICGVSGLHELADLGEFQRQRILNELNKLSNANDAIIIDTAAGISKSVVSFCLAADHVLVVTTPESTAMTDAYAMIKVLAKNNYKGQISMVVNMTKTAAEGRKVYQQIASVASRFLDIHVYCAGILPSDELLCSAVRLRKPAVLAYPKSKIARSFVTLAAKLGSRPAVNTESEGFFKKVVDWFF